MRLSIGLRLYLLFGGTEVTTPLEGIVHRDLSVVKGNCGLYKPLWGKLHFCVYFFSIVSRLLSRISRDLVPKGPPPMSQEALQVLPPDSGRYITGTEYVSQ